MSQELPKPMLDALASEAAPADHPSPDVLTAFAEHALSGGQAERVTDHLARCAECREVVFLASNAAEEPVAGETDRRAAAVIPQFAHVFASQARAPKPAFSDLPAKAPRNRWRSRLFWAVPVTAVALLVAGVVIQQRFAARSSAPPLTASVGGQAEAPAAAATQSISRPPSVESVAKNAAVEKSLKPAPTEVVPKTRHDELALAKNAPTQINGNPTREYAPSPNAVGVNASVTVGGPLATTPSTVPRSSSFAAGQTEQDKGEAAASGQFQMNPQAASRALTAMRSQWRVTAEGHLEHFVTGGWTRVLANRAATFTVVSVIQDDVWTGGTGGALFHSSNGGQQWSQVALPTPGGTESATIVSIQFDDAQHGVVVTENGSRYSTGDGGVTWTSQ